VKIDGGDVRIQLVSIIRFKENILVALIVAYIFYWGTAVVAIVW